MTATLAVALGLSLAARAQAPGLGVRINGDAGSTLYVPVKVNDAFMVEGTLSYLHFKNDTGAGTLSSYRTTSTEVGAGFFWLKPLGESTRLYAGPRVSHGKASTVYGGAPEQRADSQGWTVAPTLGVEYFPLRNVSIGGEIGASYGHATGDRSDFTGHQSVKSTQASTVSSVILRYYF
ncbi:MAG TPA: hypothetical protein VJ505_16405 [Holophagaceae bacterium]|nr:hypothetical protein [Holophagaceae bacterium]